MKPIKVQFSTVLWIVVWTVVTSTLYHGATATGSDDCWPNTSPGHVVAEQCWRDGSETIQFSCPRDLALPGGLNSFHGNCSEDATCNTIPPCLALYSCDYNDPCRAGLHPWDQFPHSDPRMFVWCGPEGQCRDVTCLGDLLFDGHRKMCIFTD